MALVKEAHTTDTSFNSGSEMKRGQDLEGNALPPGSADAGPMLELSASSSDWGSELSVEEQRRREANNAIKYRTCSWQKTAALLFSEYICLAIMSFPWSYSVLGLFPGILLTIVVASFVLYTSLIIWRFCLRHPQVRDVCDIGQMLFWNKKWAWYATAAMFILNNTFIQGVHILVISQYLNTMTNHGACTVVYGIVAAVVSFVMSLSRSLASMAFLATGSALFTFISVLLATIFSAVDPHPHGYNTGAINPITGLAMSGEPVVRALPAKGVTFVMAMSAFLNISYTFIGQITIPTFIAEMRNPEDFPKALWAVTIAEVVVFSLVGSVIYCYTGEQYITAPAFGSLGNAVFKKVSFSFMVPTLIFVGVLYASVSARFVFFRLFEGTRHKGSHTLVGWASWTGILALTWICAFLIAELVPFFSDLLSFMSSVFDSFFGFIFWGVAYYRMKHADRRKGLAPRQSKYRIYAEDAFNVIVILVGLYFLTGGTYATIQSIINNYKALKDKGVFKCTDNSL